MSTCEISFTDGTGLVTECTEKNPCRHCLREQLQRLRTERVVALVPNFTIGQCAQMTQALGILPEELETVLKVSAHVDEVIHATTTLIPSNRIMGKGLVAVTPVFLEKVVAVARMGRTQAAQECLLEAVMLLGKAVPADVDPIP